MLALSFKYKSFNVTEIYSSVQSLLLTKDREEVKNSGYACHLLSMLGNCVYYDMGLIMLHGLSIMHLIFFFIYFSVSVLQNDVFHLLVGRV